MNQEKNESITIEATVNAPVEKVWKYWNEPKHITQWAFADPSWHTPRAENDLRAGGSFNSRMEARDGSMGFDFGGTYDDVQQHRLIRYTMGDARKVDIRFENGGGQTRIVQTYEAEKQNPVEMQRGGWQAILNNFKKYAEEN